jgi:pyrimidine operon attenuation protein/uracil phosphoribosyltransferase
MRLIADAAELARAVDRIADAIAAEFPPGRGLAPALVGIRSRGEPLSRRIAAALASRLPAPPQVGVLDITLHRDDLAGRGGKTVVRPTKIPFSLDGRAVVLVDDVLHTGRTIRAALDALVDFGRPALIRLAVLAERAGRELPIQADYLAFRVQAAPGEDVRVRLSETDGRDEVVVE